MKQLSITQLFCCPSVLLVHGDEDGSTRNLPVDGAEWVELFVREMSAASDVEDARIRASRALEAFEKSVYSRAKVETAQNFQQVIILLYINFSRS